MYHTFLHIETMFDHEKMNKKKSVAQNQPFGTVKRRDEGGAIISNWKIYQFWLVEVSFSGAAVGKVDVL